jgi:hypothetical protein
MATLCSIKHHAMKYEGEKIIVPRREVRSKLHAEK